MDSLPADNHAYALLPERRRAKVLVVTEGNTYLEAALLLDEYLEVTDATPKTYPLKRNAAKYDVIIFDRVTPTDPAPTHALYGLYYLRAPERLPADLRPASDEPKMRCGTPLMHRAWLERDSYSPAQHAEFAQLVGRPVLANEALVNSTYTTVHYATTGAGAMGKSPISSDAT